jgi:glycosyltransferase involved in cell wall biosynthesis
MKKCRIAYLIDTIACDTSGTEKQLLETIERIDKKKFSPHLICLYESPWMRHHPLSCSCTVLGYKGLLKANLFSVLKKLKNLLAENNFQIVQTFFVDSIFVVWLATMFSRRKLVLLSSRRDLGLGKGNQPWYHEIFGMMLPVVNRSFDGIVANSLQVKKYISKQEKTPEYKIEVVYNGVGVPEKTKISPPVFQDNSPDLWIAVVASLTPVKRHDVLIKAIAILHQKMSGPKVRVLVLGKGPERENLIRLITHENVQEYFHFEGAVHNVSDYLQRVDIGVLCSDREGLSNAILEYMANGLPVIATAVGGNIELVNEDNGRCVPADDPAALADALQELISDQQKREQMALVSCKKVEECFSWRGSMLHLEGYYQGMVAKKRFDA